MTKVDVRAVRDTFLTNLAIMACNVITGILTARLLQPEGRGELASVILWPAIFAGLGIMGTNWALTREVAAHPEKEADLARTVVVLGLLQAGLITTLGYFLIPYLLPGDKQHLTGLTRLYLGCFLPLNFIGLNLIGLEHGRLRWRRYNLARASIVLPYLAFLLWFWWARINQVSWFVLALLVSNLFTVICCLFMQGPGIFKGKVRLADVLSLLKQGFPFFLASVSGVLASQMDKALVVSLLPTEAVGYYAVAFTFALAHAPLGGALGVTSFAALANEPDPCRQGNYLAKVFRQATWLYVGAGCAVALLAPLLIVPLFGPGFAPAALPAAILALSTSLAALGNILNDGLRGRGNTYPGIGSQFLSAGVVALAAWFWVPWLGLQGMAWASVLGSLGQLWVLVGAVIVLFPLRLTHLWGLRLRELKVLSSRIGSLWPFNGGPFRG
jgi:O-antigen/teichoic acid export membrane protein